MKHRLIDLIEEKQKAIFRLRILVWEKTFSELICHYEKRKINSHYNYNPSQRTFVLKTIDEELRELLPKKLRHQARVLFSDTLFQLIEVQIILNIKGDLND